ncbi:ribonuclease H-like domain-containing protein [Tirmania nivea]|nr:ribonuclease H-like domain-containing protein [Tirmania nivea]
MDPDTPFSTFQNEASAALVDVTKTAVGLAAEDLPFHRSFDSALASSLDRCNTTILGLVNSLLRNATAGTDLDTPKLEDVEDIETNWKDVIEVVDFLLERADTCLDEYTGAIKQKNPEVGPNARPDDSHRRKTTKPGAANMFKNRNLAKPQLGFKTKINNHDNSAWKPILKSKPHAIIPLDDSLRPFMDDKLQMQYNHPYKTEIESLTYPKTLYEHKPKVDYLPFESTKAIYVDSEGSLAEMLKDLKQAKEIAIDLEHHSDRSYVGFVCLMQISTREKDWIVDTLKLREELQCLNEVFADPKKVKVFHGAYMDIVWLQRDFGLYVVGLFDTYEAARSLGFASKSLAFLLKKYVDFDADKQYQLADWRIRPLPEEMLDYARSDTHFLLYCYDKVRNELITRSTPDVDLIGEVLFNSKETSLRRYEREAYDPVDGSGQFGWSLMLKRNPAMFTPEQLAVFKAIHQFRDKVARDEDDSHHYVMPKHHIYNLARLMPENVPGILSACAPVSPHIRVRINDIISIIRAAREGAQAEMLKALPASEAAEMRQVEAPIAAITKPKETMNVFETAINGTSRTDQSSFWGGAVGSSKWAEDATKLGKALADVRLAVPLPQLTTAIFINPNDPTTVAVQPQEPGSRAEHEFIRHRPRREEEDDIIVVKQVGGGRKRKRDKKNVDETPKTRGADDDPTPQAIDEDVIVAAEPLGQSEKERKKPKKKKTKDTTEGSASTSKEQTPFQAFDYTNAPPVLKGGDRKEERSSKAFNPYKPSVSGPKGGKRGRREKDGRSMTFKR